MYAICDKAACIEYSHLIRNSINASKKPCDDFHSYVCDGWNTREHFSVYEKHMKAFIDELAASLRKRFVPATGQTLADKAARLYQSCQSIVLGRGRDEFPQFKRLLENAGIVWPQPSTHPDVLSSMARLQNSLRIDTLLNMNIRTREKPTVGIWPSESLLGLIARRGYMRNAEDYRVYYQELYQVFSGNEVNRGSDWYAEVHANETLILSKLYKTLFAKNNVTLTTIDQLANETPSIPRSHWEKTFTQQLHADVTQPVRIVILNLDYLKAFSDICDEIGTSALHQFIGWYTVQIIAPFISQHLAMIVDGDLRTARFYTPIRCAWLTERLMGWATYVGYSTVHRDHLIKEDILGVINNVRGCLVQRVRNSPWIRIPGTVPPEEHLLDDQLKHPDILAHPGVLEVIFSNMKDMGHLLSENWKTAVDAVRHLRTVVWETLETSFLDHIMHHTAWYSLYDKNGVAVMPYVASLPLYDKGVTEAIKYGALGSLVSLASVDVLLYILNGDTSLRKTVSAKTQCYLDLSGSKAKEEFSLTHFLALDLQWRAFQNATWAQEEVRLGGLEELSENQIFFISHCFIGCGFSPEQAEAQCNGPAKASVPFAEAFRCPPGTPMNALEKCSFYDAF